MFHSNSPEMLSFLSPIHALRGLDRSGLLVRADRPELILRHQWLAGVHQFAQGRRRFFLALQDATLNDADGQRWSTHLGAEFTNLPHHTHASHASFFSKHCHCQSTFEHCPKTHVVIREGSLLPQNTLYRILQSGITLLRHDKVIMKTEEFVFLPQLHMASPTSNNVVSGAGEITTTHELDLKVLVRELLAEDPPFNTLQYTLFYRPLDSIYDSIACLCFKMS